MIKIKSVYDPVSKDDGARVLVTRYWPRGVKKEKAGLWLKGLGTEPDLIKKWKAKGLSWEKFAKSYRDEFKSEEKKKAFGELKEIIRSNGNVTLLCTCKDTEHCHREIVKEMLEKELALTRT
jgi:uncharacterized protein YeaO (DUF488 family)